MTGNTNDLIVYILAELHYHVYLPHALLLFLLAALAEELLKTPFVATNKLEQDCQLHNFVHSSMQTLSTSGLWLGVDNALKFGTMDFTQTVQCHNMVEPCQPDCTNCPFFSKHTKHFQRTYARIDSLEQGFRRNDGLV
jgi:hypothetical protein